MIPGLLVTDGPQKGRYLEILESQAFFIGRSKEAHFILEEDSSVSQKHCLLLRRASELALKDESTNGTRLNGQLIHEKVVLLKYADIIRIGNTTFQVVNLDQKTPNSDLFDFQSCLKELEERELVTDDKEEFFETIGDYSCVEIIGEGSFGAVYKAIHPEKKELVAIKLFESFQDFGPQFAGRFLREVEILRKLNHPSIIRLLEVGFGEFNHKSRHYLVLEYFPGVTLEAHVKRYGKMPWQKVVRILRQTGEALHYIHSQGILHRDLKPQNIMYDDIKGIAKIIDLGLGKCISDEADPVFNTPTHLGMGTPNFSPIEQWSSLKKVDHRADIYALGATCYYLLSGELPYGDYDSYEELYERFAQNKLDSLMDFCPSDTPSSLIKIVSKMMAFSIEDRYLDSQEFLAELEALKDLDSETSI